MTTTWKDMIRYRNRHDLFVEKLNEKMKGLVFRVAPFDIITKEGAFIEVKVSTAKEPSMHISEDELKLMGALKDKYCVYFYYNDSLLIIDSKKILEWTKNTSFTLQFGHKKSRQKKIRLSKKRLCSVKTKTFNSGEHT